MTTLYIDRKDIAVTAAHGALQVHEPSGRRGSVPIVTLERVVVHGRATLATSALGALADAGVGVLVLSGRTSRPLATLVGTPHNDVLRRLGQYEAYRDMAARRRWSATLVAAKTRAQINALGKILTERPDKRRALTRATIGLENALARVENAEPPSIATVLGLEGAAAASYFKALTEVFPPAFGFRARRRRPPPDGVNACLSLGYTLLHFEAVCACHEAGLDPLLGLLHEPAYGRESLAADAIEPFRPHVDVWAWNLLRKRVLTPESFSEDRGAVLLAKAGRQRFYQHYTPLARALRRLLRRQLHRAAREFAEFRRAPAKAGLSAPRMPSSGLGVHRAGFAS